MRVARAMVAELSHLQTPVLCTTLDGMPVILFAGTQNRRDVVYDVRLCPLDEVGCVHRGMYERTEELWNTRQVREHLRRYECTHLAGWSLGGACAVLTAARLSPRAVASVTTFGAPRCGDADFAAWYDAELGRRTLRYETTRDPIASLPRGPYVHVGRRVPLRCRTPGWMSHHDLARYADALRTW